MVGSGKSELARIIFGADKIKSGFIALNGKNVNVNSPSDAIKLGIGFLTEDPNINGLISGLSIAGNVTVANLKSVTKAGLIRKKDEKKFLTNFSRELNINSTHYNENINSLSEADKQKIILARWLFANSRIIIFDEPTNRIDMKAKIEIYQIIHNLIKRGIAVVMISSELSEVAKVCNRIVVMRNGEIAGVLSKKEASHLKIINLACGQK